MATRDDLLDELNLSPQWRLRDRPGLGMAGAYPMHVAQRDVVAEPAAAAPAIPATIGRRPPADAASSAVVPSGHDRSTPTDSDDTRRSRIAALTWPEFDADVAACIACGLCKTRKRTVPGVGATDADWLFVGEAPGAEEDATGEPFVGQAGRLLDNMLAALGLARGNRVYIANVLKCRPPGNRTPEPSEVDACQPYLDRQIALLRPRLIVALGKSAATTLLNVDATIASLRGRVHRYQGLPLVVTYHPAYLLRNLPDKAKAWEDLLFARRTIAQQGTAQASASPSASPLQ